MIGLVLSGGGARGAYEVGVLSYVFGELVRRHGRVPRVEVVCGSSVGAVNGAFVASMAHDPVGGARRLCDLWYQIDFSLVLGFGLKQFTGLPRVWLGGKTPQGIFELKYFFNSSINRVNGEAIASESVKDRIRRLIENEDPHRPLSDQRIAEMLKAGNIDIARRTVTKYREAMNILSSTKRRQVI